MLYMGSPSARSASPKAQSQSGAVLARSTKMRSVSLNCMKGKCGNSFLRSASHLVQKCDITLRSAVSSAVRLRLVSLCSHRRCLSSSSWATRSMIGRFTTTGVLTPLPSSLHLKQRVEPSSALSVQKEHSITAFTYSFAAVFGGDFLMRRRDFAGVSEAFGG